MYSNAFAKKSFPIEGESDIQMPVVTNDTVEKILTDTSLEECAQLMGESVNEVSRWIAVALRFWTSSSVDENRGIVDQVMNALNITSSVPAANSSASLVAEQDDPVNEEMRINLLNSLSVDVQHWAINRKSDSIIVLFDRDDGRILVSHDLERVYLVIDMFREEERVPQVPKPAFTVPLEVSKAIAPDSYDNVGEDTIPDEIIEYQYEAMKPMEKSVFGDHSLSQGRLVKCTLFPFQGDLILSSRNALVYSSEPIAEIHLRAALQAYIQAEDEGKIITTLPSTLRTSMRLDRVAIREDGAKMGKTIYQLWFERLHGIPMKTTFNDQPLRKPLLWSFRESNGYEMLAVSPEHDRLTPELNSISNIIFFQDVINPDTNHINKMITIPFVIRHGQSIRDMKSDNLIVHQFLAPIVEAAETIGYLPTAIALLPSYEACHILARMLRADPYLSQIRILWEVEDVPEAEMGNDSLFNNVVSRCYSCQSLKTVKGKELFHCTECLGRCVSFCCEEHRLPCTHGTAAVPFWRTVGTSEMFRGSSSMITFFEQDV